jgi:S1-C subfamily serine protease
MRALALLQFLVVATLVRALADDTASPPTLQNFEGTTSQTTPAFTIGDKCEVQYGGQGNLNIAVLASDGTIVAGAVGPHGALYLPKGGTYHLQIDYTPFFRPGPTPNSANRGTTGFQDTLNDGMGGGSSNQQQNNTPSTNSPNNGANGRSPYAFVAQPWHVDIVQAGYAKDPDQARGMPDFTVPGNVASISSTPPVATQPAATPAPSTPPTPPPAAAAPAAATAPGGPMTTDQARAVVLIQGDNGEGTGFLIKTADGPSIVTNIHVIANNPNLKVTTSTGQTVTLLSAKGAADRDLAMFAIQDGPFSYLDMATDVSKTAQTGDEVITPGNSQGGEVMLNTTGKVLGIGPQRVEIDNPIYHGNSGGPIFHTKSGKVLGVVTEAMKVDVSNDLDKASFASRNSAISGTMRYFGLRLDTVPSWVPLDWKRFQVEELFLDQFHEQSRRLDAYLNKTSSNNGDGSQQQSGSSDSSADAEIYRQDDKIMKANDRYVDQSSGADAAQRMQALHDLVFDLEGIADSNMDQIQNKDNFYSFDTERAQDEFEYRKALKTELESVANDVTRLNSLPRSN